MKKRILVFSGVLCMTVAYLLGPSYDTFAEEPGSGKKELKTKCPAPNENHYSIKCTGTVTNCDYTLQCSATIE